MQRSVLIRKAIWIAVSAALLAGAAARSGAQPDPDRWESAIQAFEESDRTHPPDEGGIVFLGSSSFRRWDLERYFPGKALINRGFGGSQMADALRYLDRIVLPLKPRTLFLYEGDNDLANGKTPRTIESEFRKMVAKVRATLPETKIVFVGVKPSLRRWHLITKVREVNARVRAITEQDDLLEFIDVDGPLLGPDGEPRRDLFVDDELHLNDSGYAIWAELVARHLD